MNEKAKEVLLRFKELDAEFSKSFDAYVDALVKNLEIPRNIAVTLVTTEMVNKNETKLILYDLFSEKTIKSVL